MWRLNQLAEKIRAIIHNKKNQLRHEITKKAWARLVNRLPAINGGKILLHIGCGDINAPGFINIDARSKPHIDIVTTNLFKLDNIPDNVAHMIYMSHVLEHVSHREIAATLNEMRRILTIGGVLRISVPDFDKITNIYESTGNDISAIEQPLMGGVLLHLLP